VHDDEASSQNFSDDDNTVQWPSDLGVGSNRGVLTCLSSAWGCRGPELRQAVAWLVWAEASVLVMF
jgi:hypothetical protein